MSKPWAYVNWTEKVSGWRRSPKRRKLRAWFKLQRTLLEGPAQTPGATQMLFPLLYTTFMNKDQWSTSTFCLLGLTPVQDSKLLQTTSYCEFSIQNVILASRATSWGPALLTLTGEMSIKLRSPLSSYLRLSFLQICKAVRRAGDNLWDSQNQHNQISIASHWSSSLSQNKQIYVGKEISPQLCSFTSPVRAAKGQAAPITIMSVCHKGG